MPYTTEILDNMRLTIASHMMPTIYNHLKSQTCVTDSKLMEMVCEETIKYANEFLRQLGHNA